MSKKKIAAALQIVCMSAFFIMSLACVSSQKAGQMPGKMPMDASKSTTIGNFLIKGSVEKGSIATDANGKSLPTNVAGYCKEVK